jgi:hypothetical protein
LLFTFSIPFWKGQEKVKKSFALSISALAAYIHGGGFRKKGETISGPDAMAAIQWDLDYMDGFAWPKSGRDGNSEPENATRPYSSGWR